MIAARDRERNIVDRTFWSSALKMVMSKFHRSGVMTGYVDYFCFAREKRFNREDDANLHRDSSFHQKNLDTIAYLETYKGENIRKVKKGYYCEYCNIFLKTSTKVGMHVKESSHVNEKGSYLIKQRDNYVLANNRVMIDEKAWHGMNENTCAICNTDFDNENVHKSLPSHSINLVGSKVEFGINDAIYRCIDMKFFQCLTCNIVCSMDQFDQHFDSTVHKNNLDRCLHHSLDHNEEDSKETKIETNSKPDSGDILNLEMKNKKESYENNNKSTESDFHRHNTKKILDSLSKFQKNDINIDFLTETAFCKKCNASIKHNFNSIEDHIVQHDGKNNSHRTLSKSKKCGIKNTDLVLTDDNSEANEPDDKVTVSGALHSDTKDGISTNNSNEATSSEPKDIKTFAKANKLTYKPSEATRNAYCRVCQIKIPSTFNNVSEHVNGTIHQKNVDNMSKSTEVVSKIPFKIFIESNFTVVNIFFQDVVINEKYCMSEASFNLITDNDSHLNRCNACSVALTSFNYKEHIEKESHLLMLAKAHVITCLDDEFVREIRPGMYHCGYCNLLIPSWKEVKKHTVCFDHVRNKTQTAKRLRSHLMEFEQLKMQKAIEFVFLVAMMRDVD